MLEVLNGTLKKREYGATGTEPLVADVFVGDEGMSLVGLGGCSLEFGIPCADEFGQDARFALDVGVSVSFQRGSVRLREFAVC